MAADIYAQAARFRAELLRGNVESARRMVAAFADARKAITEELDRLLKQIADAEAGGEEVSVAWLMRRDRLGSLLRQTNQEVFRWLLVAEGEIRAGQSAALLAGQADARDLAVMSLAMDGNLSGVFAWNRLPVDALTNIVGFLGDGTPLTKRLALAGVQAQDAVRSALVRGVALGQNPRRIAKAVRQAANLPLATALTISRTEVLRAYREASRETYRANPRLVSGWRWLAALSSRTCAACAMMHGTVHPNDEPMGSHPNCRCVMAPVLIGRDGEAFETGEEWLSRQSSDTQDQVLDSAAAGEAYRAGRVKLSDFVQTRRSDDWGVTRTQKSWKQVNPQ